MWNKETEIEFFKQAEKFANPEQLFYISSDGKYYAYWPKSYAGKKNTLQSRNSLIGKYTEKWSAELIQKFAKRKGLFVVQGLVCDEIGLSRLSPADIAICRSSDLNQSAENIIVIFEVKMSIIWNWERSADGSLVCIGDYTSHHGNPGLLRSDSMLKAIGKSISIKVTHNNSAKIPIIVLGNSPIKSSYCSKVDMLKKKGIIQGFWSVNSSPCDHETIKTSKGKGYIRMDSRTELFTFLDNLLLSDGEFFSGMMSKHQLGKIIEQSNEENDYTKKAEKFLTLIRENNDE